MKTWTILICSYNCSKTLKNALDSIVYKNNDDIDVFVVDDGSKENLYKIVKPYEKAYPNIIHYFKKENGNQGSCINFAIEHANSRFLSLLDSDDTFCKRKFNKVLSLLRQVNDGTDLVLLNFKMIFLKNGKRSDLKYWLSTSSKDIEYKTFKSLPLNKFITIHGSIYSLDLLKSCHKLPEHVGYSDNAMYYEVLLKVRNFALLNKNIHLYKYHIRGEKQAIYLANSVKKFNDIVAVYDWMLSLPLKDYGKTRYPIAKKIIGNHMYWMAVILAHNYNYSKEEKANIIQSIYKKIEKFELKNNAKGKVMPTMMRLFKNNKYGGQFFFGWIYKFIGFSFLKATKLSKEDKKIFNKLTSERNELDYKEKFFSKKHEQMIKKFEFNQSKERMAKFKKLAKEKKDE